MTPNDTKRKAVVLGAGMGGLSAAHYLLRTGLFDVTVVEREAGPGGVSGSFEYEGFTLDYGPHKIYSTIPGVMDDIRRLMGDRLVTVRKKNRIFLRGHLLDYPLRLGNLAGCLGLGAFVSLGSGYALAMAGSLLGRGRDGSYEDYVLSRFGKSAYRLVFQPLADKVWGDPSTLHRDMAAARIPSGGGLDLVLKLLRIRKETADTSAEFFLYPRKGFGDLPAAFAQSVEEGGGRLVYGAQITGLRRSSGMVDAVRCSVAGAEMEIPCDVLISAIHLPALADLIGAEVRECVGRLTFRNAIVVFLLVDRPCVIEDQWVFFPEKDFLFSRIAEQKNFYGGLGPADRTVISCDFTCDNSSPWWSATDEDLAAKCAEGLEKACLLDHGAVYGHLVKRIAGFYPRYDLEYRDNLELLRSRLEPFENLVLTGRVGMYNYNNVDHCVDMGRFVAERLAAGVLPRQIRHELEERASGYRIVD